MGYVPHPVKDGVAQTSETTVPEKEPVNRKYVSGASDPTRLRPTLDATESGRGFKEH